jgi:hypothetical protein
MRRLTTTEISGLTLAGFLVIAGIVVLICPQAVFVGHQSYEGEFMASSSLEHVSPRTARIYGGLAVAFGCGIGTLSLYRSKPD